ncbi:MAG: polysaccharide biosynthesis tyrosine autokinase [Desulfobacteraceae bacterium]|nr:MAG: polysaccharide biosynthesis tyrosine autokinase [Desulfobacteraceae bacterium]
MRMKIEKAVDKMKMQWRKADKTEPAVQKKNFRYDSSIKQWKPPVYSRSRSVELDQTAVIANRCVCLLPNSPELDCYKVLRTQIIHRTKAKGWNTIMITSIRPGEGKTLTSINLALTFAKTYNHTVLLVDCDLRQQNVYRYLNLESKMGLVDYLAHGMDLKDLIIWPKIDQFTLISGGPTIHESAELLGSPQMKALVAEMKNRYQDRYILLDAPPILAGADALILMPLVDGIVIVVESGKTSLKEIGEGLELLPKEKILGFLMNKHTSANDTYYEYYGASAHQPV